MTEPAFHSLVESVPDERVQLAMLLAYYLGLDAPQIVSLRRDDLVLERGWVGLARKLPGRDAASGAFLLPQSASLLAKVLAAGPEERASWLVPSRNRKERGAPMSADALSGMVAERSQSAGQRVTVHELQVRGAGEAIRKGEKKEEVLRRLGRTTLHTRLTRTAKDVSRKRTQKSG